MPVFKFCKLKVILTKDNLKYYQLSVLSQTEAIRFFFDLNLRTEFKVIRCFIG